MTQDDVKQIFFYKDGFLYWEKPLKNANVKVGDLAGTIHKISKRVKIQYNKKVYFASRLIFLMFHGYLPKCVDHIDRDQTNDRIENLRAATVAENQRNVALRKDNSSGVKNVCWNKRSKKWGVQLSFNGKIRHFGHYDNLELAELVALEARAKFHGKFAYLGSPQ
jgi:hypothetical protein